MTGGMFSQSIRWGLDSCRHLSLGIPRVPLKKEYFVEAADFRIRVESKTEMISAGQRAAFIDSAQAVRVQVRTRICSPCIVDLQECSLAGVWKSSATLIHLVVNGTFFTGVHCTFPIVSRMLSGILFESCIRSSDAGMESPLFV
jgi:hypothetical protein